MKYYKAEVMNQENYNKYMGGSNEYKSEFVYVWAETKEQAIMKAHMAKGYDNVVLANSVHTVKSV